MRQAYDYWQDQPGNYLPSARAAAREQPHTRLRSTKRSFVHNKQFTQLCLAWLPDLSIELPPPRSAAPICAFPSKHHAATTACVSTLRCTRARFGVSCDIAPNKRSIWRLVRHALSHCCVSSIAAHRETIQASPQSHDTLNAHVLPFTAVAIGIRATRRNSISRIPLSPECPTPDRHYS